MNEAAIVPNLFGGGGEVLLAGRHPQILHFASFTLHSWEATSMRSYHQWTYLSTKDCLYRFVRECKKVWYVVATCWESRMNCALSSMVWYVVLWYRIFYNCRPHAPSWIITNLLELILYLGLTATRASCHTTLCSFHRHLTLELRMISSGLDCWPMTSVGNAFFDVCSDWSVRVIK